MPGPVEHVTIDDVMHSLIGREDELRSLEAFFAAVAHGPSALVLSGEAGIGKTALWELGVEEAGRSIGRVLTCRGVEAEASLSFAALSDLLGEALEEAAPALVPPRRRALEVALLLAEPGDAPPDAHAVGLAVLDLLGFLAAGGPLVVAFDDAQWLDPASAAVLLVALRRLRAERVGLLATLRTGPEGAVAFELDRGVVEVRRQRITVGPLSLGAVHALLRERLGLELTRPELARVQEATAGNPFFALELGRELVRTGARPASGQALKVPDSLRELLGGRLARLPGESLDVLLQAAALARPTIDLVAAAHGEQDRVLRALEAAAQEGVVALEDTQIRFTHPLLASICYEEAPAWKRRAVHQALAGAVGDMEERARHRALAVEGPDAAVAAELAAAAEEAAARGATASAAELAELAARLGPDDAALARERRRRAASFHRLAGDSTRAAALLEELLGEVPSGVERSDILFELGSTFRADRAGLIALCDEALAEAGEDDARSARILAHRSLHRLLAADIPTSLADARLALERAERAGDPALVASAIARLGHAEAYAVEITPGLLERGVEIEERMGCAREYYESPRFFLSRRLVALGDLDLARATLTRALGEAEGRGDEGSKVAALWYLAMTDWYAGRLHSALEHATAAQELGEQIQFGHARAWVARVMGLLQVDLGLADVARASCEAGLAFARATGNESYVMVTIAALGRLELALGNLTAAAGYLRDLPARLIAAGWGDPTFCAWPDAIETMVALGDTEQARAYLEHYSEYAHRSGSPLAVAWEARCRGLLAAASGDIDGAFAAFQSGLAGAAAVYELERARTLLCLGVAQRQAQQKRLARETLDEALAVFQAQGALLWAAKARTELKRISGRRAAAEELTETEQLVAALAASGHTNREIAAELYMGVSTVEAHLSRIYRKLGVRSRTELGARQAASADPGTHV